MNAGREDIVRNQSQTNGQDNISVTGHALQLAATKIKGRIVNIGRSMS